MARGKFDIALYLLANGDNTDVLSINRVLVSKMVSAINQIVDQLRSAARINALDILKWIGVVQKQALDRSQVLTQTLQKIDTAIEQLL